MTTMPLPKLADTDEMQTHVIKSVLGCSSLLRQLWPSERQPFSLIATMGNGSLLFSMSSPVTSCLFMYAVSPHPLTHGVHATSPGKFTLCLASHGCQLGTSPLLVRRAHDTFPIGPPSSGRAPRSPSSRQMDGFTRGGIFSSPRGFPSL